MASSLTDINLLKSLRSFKCSITFWDLYRRSFWHVPMSVSCRLRHLLATVHLKMSRDIVWQHEITHSPTFWHKMNNLLFINVLMILIVILQWGFLTHPCLMKTNMLNGSLHNAKKEIILCDIIYTTFTYSYRHTHVHTPKTVLACPDLYSQCVFM